MTPESFEVNDDPLEGVEEPAEVTGICPSCGVAFRDVGDEEDIVSAVIHDDPVCKVWERSTDDQLVSLMVRGVMIKKAATPSLEMKILGHPVGVIIVETFIGFLFVMTPVILVGIIHIWVTGRPLYAGIADLPFWTLVMPLIFAASWLVGHLMRRKWS